MLLLGGLLLCLRCGQALLLLLLVVEGAAVTEAAFMLEAAPGGRPLGGGHYWDGAWRSPGARESLTATRRWLLLAELLVANRRRGQGRLWPHLGLPHGLAHRLAHRLAHGLHWLALWLHLMHLCP